MNDETTAVIVVAAALATYVFMAVQFKVQKANRQRSLGGMYQPVPKEQQPPTTPPG
ncbi:MAG: hypothetical protein ABMA26_17145 [Limisphaerales bacterium]